MKNRMLISQFGRRNKELRLLGFNSYQEYLKSDYWRKIKKLWFSRRKSKPHEWDFCYSCGTKENLQLHHLNYKDMWRIRLHNLRSLCGDCHKMVHDLSQTKFKMSIKQATKKITKVNSELKRERIMDYEDKRNVEEEFEAQAEHLRSIRSLGKES